MIFVNDSVTCAGPWRHLRIDPSGARYCDCSNDITDAVSVIQWFRDSEHVQQARRQIQQGHPLEGCQRCYDAEHKTGLSFRVEKNIETPVWPAMHSTTMPNGPSEITVSFSNLCNNRCIMCDAGSSSLIAQDQGMGTTSISDHNNQEILKFLKHTSHLRRIELNGGEPFIQTQFKELVKNLVENKLTHVHLGVHTNGTVWDQELVNMLKKFNNLTLAISIETMHPSNNYIRLGSDWQQVKENISKFRRNLLQAKNIFIHCVPQALSVFHIDTLFDYCLENKISLMGNPLYRPRHHEIRVLPNSIKLRLAQYLRHKYSVETDRLDTHGGFVGVEGVIRKVIQCLEHPEDQEIHIDRQRFFLDLDQFDHKHNLDHTDIWPELQHQ